MTTKPGTARYRRILVKLSGEALLGNEDYGIDPVILKRIAGEIRDLTQMGVQVAVVLGGGNIFRGAGLARAGMGRLGNACGAIVVSRHGCAPAMPTWPELEIFFAAQAWRAPAWTG